MREKRRERDRESEREREREREVSHIHIRAHASPEHILYRVLLVKKKTNPLYLHPYLLPSSTLNHNIKQITNMKEELDQCT